MRSIKDSKPGSVSILIGPNGSGKSRRLRKLCDEALREGIKVIAIAPTIYDRFLKIRSPNFRFFGARQGRAASKKVIRDLIIRAASDDPQILKNLVQALKYTNFAPSVGVSIDWVNFSRFDEVSRQIAADLELEPREHRDLEFALRLWSGGRDREKWRPQDDEFPWGGSEEWKGHTILKFSMEKFSFDELHRLTYISLLRYESLLVKLKVIAQPKYYFFRDGLPIPLLEACSGELCFITSVAFITAEIESNCCVMVDEPDNSLHPTWQKNYVRTILDLFYHFQPRIVISTHSPIIVSGGELADQKTRVFEMTGVSSEEHAEANLNLEEMYVRLFDLVTPKSHYLSERVVDLLNRLNSGAIRLESVIVELKKLEAMSYDEEQKAVLTSFEKMAEQISEKKGI